MLHRHAPFCLIPGVQHKQHIVLATETGPAFRLKALQLELGPQMQALCLQRPHSKQRA